MSKAPSEATQLRNAKATIKRLEAESELFQRQSGVWHTRAVKAEKELDEWKTRFDLLLRRTGEPTP